jgi:hypothetical protein
MYFYAVSNLDANIQIAYPRLFCFSHDFLLQY